MIQDSPTQLSAPVSSKMRYFVASFPLHQILTIVALAFLIGNVPVVAGQTSVGFYASSCPGAESIISASVRAASVIDSSVPPKLLRLLFHDCFVEGCDGSILLDSTGDNQAEKSDPANLTLEGFGVIDTIKRTLELVCSGVVSCADILALAAREAVIQMGGPSVQIETGRKDGFVSLASNVRANLPDTPFNVDELISFFSKKGLSQNDLVVLSGAHTVGVAHCSAFNDRFTFSSNGTVTGRDPTLDPAYAQQLVSRCPANPDPSTLIVNDLITPSVFDNAYYMDVQLGRALFHSDAVLFTDGRTKALVDQFAKDQNSFFASWEQSFLKLSLVGVKSGSAGEVRKTCRTRNTS